MKDIVNKHKNKLHGYQEWYGVTNKLLCRCIYKHGDDIGYEEYHTAKKTTFYIK
jgi:hypothetical protein